MLNKSKLMLLTLLAAFALAPLASVASADTTVKRYTVVLAGTETETGFNLAGTSLEVSALISAAGGTVTIDLSRQIGVLAVESSNSLFLDLVRSSGLVADAAEEYVWKQYDV